MSNRLTNSYGPVTLWRTHAGHLGIQGEVSINMEIGDKGASPDPEALSRANAPALPAEFVPSRYAH